MKRKTAIKATLDLIMTLVFALLFNKMVLGLGFHEAAGLAIGIAIVIHLVLNYKWIIQISKRFFSKSLPSRVRLGYILNVLLLLSFIAIILSGIFISKVFLVSVRGFGTLNYKVIHLGASKFALILIGIHIGLHWTFIKQVLGKMFRKVNAKVQRGLAILMIMALVFGGGYSLVTTGIISKIGGMEGGHEMGMKGERPSFNEGSTSGPSQGEGGNTDFVERGSEKGGHEMDLGVETISLVNVLSVIGKYVSAMGFIALITAFIDQIVVRNKRRRMVLSTN